MRDPEAMKKCMEEFQARMVGTLELAEVSLAIAKKAIQGDGSISDMTRFIREAQTSLDTAIDDVLEEYGVRLM